jgi:hypothetical protein
MVARLDSYEHEEGPTELEMVYDQLHETQQDFKHANLMSGKRIVELEAALEEALEYFKDKYDMRDGEDGKQLPNEEMRLGVMIEEAIYGIRF